MITYLLLGAVFFIITKFILGMEQEITVKSYVLPNWLVNIVIVLVWPLSLAILLYLYFTGKKEIVDDDD